MEPINANDDSSYSECSMFSDFYSSDDEENEEIFEVDDDSDDELVLSENSKNKFVLNK
jgi:hypothetical protein